MKITGVGRALPSHYYDQATLTRYLGAAWAAHPGVVSRLSSLHQNTRVKGRHLALPLERYAELRDFTASNREYVRCAVDLGERAIRDALDRAFLQPRDVDALFFSTVTGVCSPSVDAKLVNRLGLRPDVRRVPMFGLGCVAGAAAVSRAADFVRGMPAAVAVVLTVELCSLTLQFGDTSVANLISTGLFGDGASAAVITGDARRGSGPEILATRSVFYPDTEDVMGWDIGSHGFRIVLSAAVPQVAGEQLPRDVDAFLQDHGLTRTDISSWVCHPGGPKVLQALQQGLGLDAAALQCSWDSLEQRGNLSSASVLLILGDTMYENCPAPGTKGVMLAMGPGFCSELLLLQW